MACNNKVLKISLIVVFVILMLLSIVTVICMLEGGESMSPADGIAKCIAVVVKIILAAMSCCAVKRESTCLIITLSIFLCFSVLGDILSIPGILVANNQSLIVNLAWINQKSMDTLQSDYKCCGKTGPEDYISINKTIPASCYSNHNVTTADVLYKDGCNAKMHEVRGPFLAALFIANCLSLVLGITGFVLTILLCRNFRNKRRRRNI